MARTDKMISVLRGLGVSFDEPTKLRCYRFEGDYDMPLVIEQWMDGGRNMMRVSHFYERGDDLKEMPAVVYEVESGMLSQVWQ